MVLMSSFERNPNFIFRKIVDEGVLVPIHNDLADMNCIYTLNDVGTFIWNQLEQAKTLLALETALQNEYEGKPEEIRADLDQFLDELISVGAVRKA